MMTLLAFCKSIVTSVGGGKKYVSKFGSKKGLGDPITKPVASTAGRMVRVLVGLLPGMLSMTVGMKELKPCCSSITVGVGIPVVSKYWTASAMFRKSVGT